MSIHKEYEYTSDVKNISGIQFSILSSEEVLKRSVAHINEPTLYDSNGEPKIGGLFDPRMGIIERNKRCTTCGLDNIFCPGHFGHTELAKPVFHIQYKEYIIKIMRCICIRCSKLLIDTNDSNIQYILEETKNNHKKRFDSIYNKAHKVKVCSDCGAIQPDKYNKQAFEISAEWKIKDSQKKSDTESQFLTPESIMHRFKRISEEDCLALGFSPKWCMPHWLICSILPVVPPCVRPSVRQ